MSSTDFWYAGIDLGTSSCKCAVINKQGKVLGISAEPYSNISIENEQDPGNIYAALLRVLRRAWQSAGVQPGNCMGAALGCALHSLLLLDEKDRPLTPVINWIDGRAAKIADQYRTADASTSLYQNTGCPPHGMYPLYKMIWFRKHQPDIFQKTNRFVSLKEYIFARLTGEFLVDFSLASGSGLLNIHTQKWHNPALDLIGISPRQLSTVRDPRTSVPINNRAFFDETGFPEGIKLTLGSSDAANSSLGAGAVHSGQAACMIGTSGAYRVFSPHPVLDQDQRTWCYCVDWNHWIVGGAINNGGLSLTWLQNMLQAGIPDQPKLSYQQIIQLAKKADPGSSGLYCLPFFTGERSPNWNLNARGMFIGLNVTHDLTHLCRAILEGIAFRMRSLDLILEEISDKISIVRASGGYTKSNFWTQLTCDVLQKQCEIPQTGDTSALGSALWALLSAENENRIQELEDFVRVDQVFEPDLSLANLYQEMHNLFEKIYDQNSPLFFDLAQLQETLTAKKNG